MARLFLLVLVGSLYVMSSGIVKAADDLTEKVAALNKEGDEAVQNKAYGKARSLYQKVIKLDNGNSHALLNHADTYYAEAKYQEAIAGYSSAIKADAKNATAFHWRGDAYVKLKEYPKAIDDYSKAISLSPSDVSVYEVRGIAFDKLEKYKDAILDFTIALQAVKGDDAKASLHNRRASSELKLNDYKAAAADFVSAASLVRQSTGAGWMNAAKALMSQPNVDSKDIARAVEYSHTACLLSKNLNVDWISFLAAALAENGQFSAAVQIQRKAIARMDEKGKQEAERRLQLYMAKKKLDLPLVQKTTE